MDGWIIFTILIFIILSCPKYQKQSTLENGDHALDSKMYLTLNVTSNY